MWEGAKSLYNWGPPPPPSFLAPDDLAELMAGAHALSARDATHATTSRSSATDRSDRRSRSCSASAAGASASFEKQPAAYPLPRAVHFDHEVGRILQAAGVAGELAGRTEPADVYEWRNAAGETLLRFESEAAGLSGWPDANMFAQPELERLLDRAGARAADGRGPARSRGRRARPTTGDGVRLEIAVGRRQPLGAPGRATWSAATAPTASCARHLGVAGHRPRASSSTG